MSDRGPVGEVTDRTKSEAEDSGNSHLAAIVPSTRAFSRTCSGGVKITSGAVGILALGAGFGAATSLVNAVSSPYGSRGSRLANAGWTWVAELAEVPSLHWALAG